MATTHKAISMARDLADALRKRLPSKTVTESFDTDGSPLIAIDDGSPATGEENVLLKVRPLDWPLAKDVLGLAQTVFTPHVIQMATEAEADADASVIILSRQTLLHVLGEVLGKGCKVEWYESANTVVPVAGTFIAGNLKASYDSLYWPMVSGQ